MVIIIFKIPKTFNGNTDLDKVFLNLFKNDKKVEIFNFRERHGNDEIVFESPGYNIPTITLTRVPFKEYHTDLDTPKIVKNDMLNKTKKITFNAISILENNYLLKNKKKGLVCLSSPNYNLYIAPKQPGIIKANEIIQQNIEWNLLMNSLPLNIDRKKVF